VTRVYVPATIESLARWHQDGRVPGGALADGYAAPDETEEGEYAALMSAADASAGLLSGSGRRVVVVVDAPAGDAAVAWNDVVAVHADLADRPAGADPDEDLGWFATQEVPDLLG
jgi:hypothetical protein